MASFLLKYQSKYNCILMHLSNSFPIFIDFRLIFPINPIEIRYFYISSLQMVLFHLKLIV